MTVLRPTLLLALLAWGQPLAAQSWEGLQALRPGDRIKIQDAAGKEHKGAFKTSSADAITIETGKGEETISRAQVRRVEVRGSSRRVRNFVIGAAIGFALGLVVDQTLGAFFRNEGGESDGARALTYIGPIALFGSLGAASPGYRTVYRIR